MGVPWATPKSSILIGLSIINHPFWEPPFMEALHINIVNNLYTYCMLMYVVFMSYKMSRAITPLLNL